MTYIWHVTLNSGHALRQDRSDITEDAVAALSTTLDGILQGAHLTVPGFPGYVVNGSHHGHDLIATLWRGPVERRVPILTTATALKSRSARQLWELLHDQSTVPLMTQRERPPAAPWVADRLEIGAAGDPDALLWTGDFSRCLAWTWAEYRGGMA
jgi:hypothetical protein